MSKEAEPLGSRSTSVVLALALAGWLVLSRGAYLADAPLMSKDGPLYITSLELGPDYCVPMPGNLGYVLLGRLALNLRDEPRLAFAVVNGLLTLIGGLYVHLLARRMVGEPLACATALAIVCNPLVWWHGETINSYLVWLAVLPAIAFHGLRFVDTGRDGPAIACSLALGVGSMLRQDLLAFGGPLWLGCMVIGRASRRQAALGGAVVCACTVSWFVGMSAILGGPGEYLTLVGQKHAGHMEGYSVVNRGIFEGLVRNSVKYGLFLLWSVPLVAPLALVTLLGRQRGAGGSCMPGKLAGVSINRALVLAGLWVLPSVVFSLGVFAGNAGLVFPALPVLYLAAAAGLDRLLRSEGRWWPALAMATVALASAGQFIMTPVLRETDQRRVILNVTLLRYSGAGLNARLDRNLDDYGIDPSLASVISQLRSPQPLPGKLAWSELGRDQQRGLP